MPSTSPSADDLRIFARVARLASFTRAAEQLQLPRATVSTAVLRLESRLGARLLQRTTRRVQLTSDGQEFLDRSERLLADLDELGALFQHRAAQVSGRLRVDMPLGMATGRLMSRLPEFLRSYPSLAVEIHSADRRVDPVAEGFDCVIRVGAVVDESLAARPLGELPMVNVVSQAYAERHGTPQALADLPAHWLVDYRPNPTDDPAAFDYVDPAAGRRSSVPMRHLVTVSNSAAYEAACRAGLGIVQLPVVSAARGVAEGILVDVLPAFRPAPMPVHLLFPHRRHLPRRVRAFADWVGDVLGAPG